MDIFQTLGRDRSQSSPCWIFRVKQIHQSTASERTTRLPVPHLYRWRKSWPPSIRPRRRRDSLSSERARCLPGAVLMLEHRRRRCTSIETTPGSKFRQHLARRHQRYLKEAFTRKVDPPGILISQRATIFIFRPGCAGICPIFPSFCTSSVVLTDLNNVHKLCVSSIIVWATIL